MTGALREAVRTALTSADPLPELERLALANTPAAVACAVAFWRDSGEALAESTAAKAERALSLMRSEPRT